MEDVKTGWWIQGVPYIYLPHRRKYLVTIDPEKITKFLKEIQTKLDDCESTKTKQIAKNYFLSTETITSETEIRINGESLYIGKLVLDISKDLLVQLIKKEILLPKMKIEYLYGDPSAHSLPPIFSFGKSIKQNSMNKTFTETNFSNINEILRNIESLQREMNDIVREYKMSKENSIFTIFLYYISASLEMIRKCSKTLFHRFKENVKSSFRGILLVFLKFLHFGILVSRFFISGRDFRQTFNEFFASSGICNELIRLITECCSLLVSVGMDLAFLVSIGIFLNPGETVHDPHREYRPDLDLSTYYQSSFYHTDYVSLVKTMFNATKMFGKSILQIKTTASTLIRDVYRAGSFAFHYATSLIPEGAFRILDNIIRKTRKKLNISEGDIAYNSFENMLGWLKSREERYIQSAKRLQEAKNTITSRFQLGALLLSCAPLLMMIGKCIMDTVLGNWIVAILSYIFGLAAGIVSLPLVAAIPISTCLLIFTMQIMNKVIGTIWNFLQYKSCMATSADKKFESEMERKLYAQECWNSGVEGLTSINISSHVINEIVGLEVFKQYPQYKHFFIKSAELVNASCQGEWSFYFAGKIKVNLYNPSIQYIKSYMEEGMNSFFVPYLTIAKPNIPLPLKEKERIRQKEVVIKTKEGISVSLYENSIFYQKYLKGETISTNDIIITATEKLKDDILSGRKIEDDKNTEMNYLFVKKYTEESLKDIENELESYDHSFGADLYSVYKKEQQEFNSPITYREFLLNFKTKKDNLEKIALVYHKDASMFKKDMPQNMIKMLDLLQKSEDFDILYEEVSDGIPYISLIDKMINTLDDKIIVEEEQILKGHYIYLREQKKDMEAFYQELSKILETFDGDSTCSVAGVCDEDREFISKNMDFVKDSIEKMDIGLLELSSKLPPSFIKKYEIPSTEPKDPELLIEKMLLSLSKKETIAKEDLKKLEKYTMEAIFDIQNEENAYHENNVDRLFDVFQQEQPGGTVQDYKLFLENFEEKRNFLQKVNIFCKGYSEISETPYFSNPIMKKIDDDVQIENAIVLYRNFHKNVEQSPIQHMIAWLGAWQNPEEVADYGTKLKVQQYAQECIYSEFMKLYITKREMEKEMEIMKQPPGFFEKFFSFDGKEKKIEEMEKNLRKINRNIDNYKKYYEEVVNQKNMDMHMMRLEVLFYNNEGGETYANYKNNHPDKFIGQRNIVISENLKERQRGDECREKHNGNINIEEVGYIVVETLEGKPFIIHKDDPIYQKYIENEKIPFTHLEYLQHCSEIFLKYYCSNPTVTRTADSILILMPILLGPVREYLNYNGDNSGKDIDVYRHHGIKGLFNKFIRENSVITLTEFNNYLSSVVIKMNIIKNIVDAEIAYIYDKNGIRRGTEKDLKTPFESIGSYDNDPLSKFYYVKGFEFAGVHDNNKNDFAPDLVKTLTTDGNRDSSFIEPVKDAIRKIKEAIDSNQIHTEEDARKLIESLSK